ncbi:MAG: U-box domain-containing protein, partial [Candidatus Thermoplasmatota archaeon]|nr:U-box domain-containing protein [Candidatus Thermoplasmatota archaeon]
MRILDDDDVMSFFRHAMLSEWFKNRDCPVLVGWLMYSSPTMLSHFSDELVCYAMGVSDLKTIRNLHVLSCIVNALEVRCHPTPSHPELCVHLETLIFEHMLDAFRSPLVNTLSLNNRCCLFSLCHKLRLYESVTFCAHDVAGWIMETHTTFLRFPLFAGQSLELVASIARSHPQYVVRCECLFKYLCAVSKDRTTTCNELINSLISSFGTEFLVRAARSGHLSELICICEDDTVKALDALWPGKLASLMGGSPSKRRRVLLPSVKHECPITQDACVDPVVATDGHTYERDAILTVILNGFPSPVSPMTREKIDLRVVPNRDLLVRDASRCPVQERGEERGEERG